MLGIGLYLFFFVLNALFPTQSDDFGAPLGGIDSMMHSYMHWNGRIGELLKVWFGSYLSHTPYFAFINALFGVGFFYLMFALLFGRFPTLTLIDCAAIALMLFVLMAFRAFGAIFFWAAGSLNYLWAYCFILLYLLPYRIFWQAPSAHTRFSLLKALGIFVLGVIAGWSSELGIVVVVFQIALLGFGLWRRISLPLWYYVGIVGFVAGWIVLYASPGHRVRAINHFQKSGAYISISDFLAMSFQDKFARWQRVFGSHQLYVTQVFVYIALWWAYICRIYKTLPGRILLITLGIIPMIMLAFVYPKSLGFLVTPIILGFSLYLAYMFYKHQEDMKARYATIITFVLLAYFISIAATLQMGLPGRARLHYGIFDISLLILMCKILGEDLTQRTRELFQKLIIMICVLFGLFVLMACADMRLKWERMLASIAAQKAMGVTEIIVETQTFVSYYGNYTGWSNPGSNPDVWPNNVYARVFGVQKFTAR
ncbi:DUF6056 family protein [uncultured Helicobacter sp.]|uniref:DUF6056 family protein n=1 Tax=uncultured Helicobacter sp. TaxID=175537 RepID=UPI00374E581C